MDNISLERITEHEPHGWVVEMELEAVHALQRVPGYWMACSCGWHGWIMADPERPPVESYQSRF